MSCISLAPLTNSTHMKLCVQEEETRIVSAFIINNGGCQLTWLVSHNKHNHHRLVSGFNLSHGLETLHSTSRWMMMSRYRQIDSRTLLLNKPLSHICQIPMTLT